MTKIYSNKIMKQSIRNNWKIWTMLTAVLCVFISLTMISSADTSENAFVPPGVKATTAMDILAQTFFGMMGIIIIILYAISVANRLIASDIDKGTMSYTLNTPVTRLQVVFTKFIFYITSLMVMTALTGTVGTIVNAIGGYEYAMDTFWLLILGYFLLSFALGGICFFASCWFNKSSNSLMVGAGFSIAFFIFDTLSAFDTFSFLQYLSLNSLFDASAIIAGSGFVWGFIALLLIGIVLYTIGIIKFLKKDLPL